MCEAKKKFFLTKCEFKGIHPSQGCYIPNSYAKIIYKSSYCMILWKKNQYQIYLYLEVTLIYLPISTFFLSKAYLFALVILKLKKCPHTHSHTLNNIKELCLQWIQKKNMNIRVRPQKQNSIYAFPCCCCFFVFIQCKMLLMAPVHKSIQSPYRRHTLKLGLSFCHFNNAMHFIGVWPNLERKKKRGERKTIKLLNTMRRYSAIAIVQQHADKIIIIIAIILLIMMVKTMVSFATLYPRC